MSDLLIGPNQLKLTRISQTSNSPVDTSTTENGIIVHTYFDDAQRYEFRLTGMTTTLAEYGATSAILEQLSSADTFLLDLYAYGAGVLPLIGSISGRLFVDGAVAAGASTIPFITDDSNPSGVAPAGALAVGDLVQYTYVGYDYPEKLYRVTQVNASSYNIFPSLRGSIQDETEIIFGSAIRARVRLSRDTIRFTSRGVFPNIRNYTLSVTEDYTST